VSRVAAKIAARAGERRRAYWEYGRAFRRTRWRFSPQPPQVGPARLAQHRLPNSGKPEFGGPRVFWSLASLLVAHDQRDHFAPRA